MKRSKMSPFPVLLAAAAIGSFAQPGRATTVIGGYSGLLTTTDGGPFPVNDMACVVEGGGWLSNGCTRSIVWEQQLPVQTAGPHSIGWWIQQDSASAATPVTCMACANDPTGPSVSCTGPQTSGTFGQPVQFAGALTVPTSTEFGGTNPGGPVFSVCTLSPGARLFSTAINPS